MLPIEIHIKTAELADANDIAYVHIESWKSTYRDIIAQEYLDGLDYADREALWTRILSQPGQRNSVFVAVDTASRQLIGFSNGGPSRWSEYPDFPGEVFAIYLLKAYQNLGIGRQLFEASCRQLSEDGFNGFLLWVLKNNPSCRFYEKMGGQVVGTTEVTIGGALLQELAYGWNAAGMKGIVQS